MTIKYIFWDSDNTLVDTKEHHWRKHKETLKSLGISLDPTYRERIYTNNGAQNWEWLVDELELNEEKQSYLDKIDQWYFDHINQIQVRPGVIEALEFFQSQGYKQAVVSNGRRRSVMAALEGKKLTLYFEFVLCKEDYEGRKPDPAPYLTALSKMENIEGTKIAPTNCVVIEDDPLGVESAKAAEMYAVHRRLTRDQTVHARADYTAFADVDFLEIVTKLIPSL